MLTDPPYSTQVGNGVYSTTWIGNWTQVIVGGNWLRPVSGSVWRDPMPTALGAQFAVLNSGGSYRTDLAQTYQADTLYTLSFTHFRRDNQPGDPIKADLMTTAGSVVATASFDAVTSTDTYVTRTLTFDTAVDESFNGQNIRIRFSDPNGGTTTNGQAALDNIILTADASVDTTVPTIGSLAPQGGGVYPGDRLVATFSENIALAGSGTITITDMDDGSGTVTISLSDASQVTISGQVLTIDPATALAAGTDYAVQIAPGAVQNYSGLPFAGIPVHDETTWNFRTATPSPNIIFILGDDQAWYDYGFMRRPGVEKAAIDLDPSIPQVAKTPAIDRLADEGLTFIHGYSAPVCRPALTSLITGTHPHPNWITGNDLASGPDAAVEARMQAFNPLPRTLATELDYTSFQTGKWWEGHFSNGGFTHGDTVNSTATGTAPPQWSGSRPSYVVARHDDWGLMAGRVDYVNDVAEPAHPIPYANTVQTVTDFINAQVAADHSFFLWYAPFLPHTPHDPPGGLLAEYTALGLNSEDAKYYANIERFDGGVGAILDHLDAQGIADNTIVVMICDNGRQYDLATIGKLTPYDTGARTPIIVRWPDRIKPGGTIEPQTIRTPVSSVDIAPTVLQALGLSTHPEMRGINLLDPEAVAAHKIICGENHNHDILDLPNPWASLTSRFAVRGGWKLICFTNGITELYHLYDTSTGTPVDPHEDNDLSASHPQLVSELSVAMANHYAADPNDFGSWISDPVLDIDPAAQGINHDSDGDQLANGLEAWFGTHPGQFNAGLANPATVGTSSTFTHPQNPNPPADLAGFYEWSQNLIDWYVGDGVDGPPGGPTVTISPATIDTTTTVSAEASGELKRLFVRVGVRQD